MTALDLKNRVALVTGSSRGIGLAIAKRLAECGAHIVLNGRYQETLDKAAELFTEYGVECLPVAADVGDFSQVEDMIRKVFNRFKRLDIMVNNAGVLHDDLIGMIRKEDVAATIQTNLIGVLHGTQAAARLMMRKRSGSIINTSSIMGRRGNAGELVYSASKSGVIGATLSAAKELAPMGIRVNAIAPGFIDTDMTRGLNPDLHRKRVESIGMGRIGKVEDVADVVLFLASDLSRYVTGQIIGVDGGMLV